MPHAASRKPSPPATPATVSFSPLKNCFLNLPTSLVSVLTNSNTPAQNVVVEISFRTTTSSSSGTTSTSRCAYAGWTGMSSKRKPGAGRVEDAVVEMDPAFARNVGLSEGSKVRQLLNYLLHIYTSLQLPIKSIIAPPNLCTHTWFHLTYTFSSALIPYKPLLNMHPRPIFLDHLLIYRGPD